MACFKNTGFGFFFQSVDDVDTENLQDTAQCALYAPFIFRYYKEREVNNSLLIIFA